MRKTLPALRAVLRWEAILTAPLCVQHLCDALATSAVINVVVPGSIPGHRDKIVCAEVISAVWLGPGSTAALPNSSWVQFRTQRGVHTIPNWQFRTEVDQAQGSLW